MSIEFLNVCKSFDDKNVLDDFSISFNDNEITCLLGQSGCGKTTILNLISDILNLDKGTINGNKDKKIAFIFQDERLIPNISALDNVLLVCNNLKDNQISKAKKLMNDIGLKNDIDKKPFELSGGMNQRVNIIRALMYDADIILMDEPFSALDYHNKELAMNIIKRETMNKTVIMVTHDKDEALMIADNIYVFSELPLTLKGKLKISIDFYDRKSELDIMKKYDAELFDIIYKVN